MVVRRGIRLTDWDAPPKLSQQLSQLERKLWEATESDVPSSLVIDASQVGSGTKVKLTIPNRDVSLGHVNRGDSWSVVSDDFYGGGSGTTEYVGPFLSREISSAAKNVGASTSNADHPGTYTVAASTTLANSGVCTRAGRIVLSGSEYVVAVLKTPSDLTNTIITVGLFDSDTSMTEPSDGCYLYTAAGGTMVGKNAVGSSRSTTSGSVTLDADQWYTALVKLKRDASSSLFSLYSQSGVKLFSESLAQNIPSGVSLFAGIKQGLTVSSGSAISCGETDYLEVRAGGPGRKLNRFLGSESDVDQ